jgi:hypothetical protein
MCVFNRLLVQVNMAASFLNSCKLLIGSINIHEPYGVAYIMSSSYLHSSPHKVKYITDHNKIHDRSRKKKEGHINATSLFDSHWVTRASYRLWQNTVITVLHKTAVCSYAAYVHCQLTKQAFRMYSLFYTAKRHNFQQLECTQRSIYCAHQQCWAIYRHCDCHCRWQAIMIIYLVFQRSTRLDIELDIR